MTDEEVHAACAFILSDPISTRTVHCTYCPHVRLDKDHAHAVTCKHGNHVMARHHELRDEIWEVAKEAGYLAHREVAIRGQRQLRPADIEVSRFASGRDVMFDVTVVSPLQRAYVNLARHGLNPVFEIVERKKRQRNHVGDRVRELNKVFTPLMVTIYGSWSDTARATFKAMAYTIAQNNGVSRSQVVESMFARLNFKLLRANARAILDRLPPLPISERA